jgi:hypothetical protein
MVLALLRQFIHITQYKDSVPTSHRTSSIHYMDQLVMPFGEIISADLENHMKHTNTL